MGIVKKISKLLWLIRKGFLSGFGRLHYSQFGEDIVLKELLDKDALQQHIGFFVDVGCYHPKKFSNTYMLYKKGWRGINIDMEADKISLFNWVRPKDYNVLSPISDKKEQVQVYRFGAYGLGSTINPQFAIETGLAVQDVAELVTKTLDEVIADSPFNGRQIDVLSIDVEGMDFKVLSSLSLARYKPKIIIIESHHTSIAAIMATDIYQYLTAETYVLRSWVFYSLVFVLPDADILKDREKTP